MRKWLWMLVLVLVGSASAQTITNVALVPPTLQSTNQNTIQSSFTLTGFTQPITVQYQRDDGATDTVSGLQNGANTITLVLSDLGTQNGRQTSWQVVATDSATPTPNIRIVAGPRVRFDNSPPGVPTTISPQFPATIFADNFQIRGTVVDSTNQQPVTSGTVLITRQDPPFVGEVIGAGALSTQPTPGSFLAAVDLSRITTGVATQISIRAIDEAGNQGQPLLVTVTRQTAPPPTFSTAPTCQPGGPLTNNPAVLIRGTVTGQVPPFNVHFFVDGIIESTISGLADGQDFAHTLNLPSQGRHDIRVQVANSNQPPDRSRAVLACSLTLDTVSPGPPLVLQPNPALATFLTSGPTFVLEGISTERAFCTTSPACPRPVVRINGPSGVTFLPASPLAVDDISGQFRTVATLPSTLSDGRYAVLLTSVDAATNTSNGSVAQVLFDLDRTPPTVSEIRINNVLAPQSQPPIFVGRATSQVQVRTSEPLENIPTLRFTQGGGSVQTLGLTSGTGSVFNYAFTPVTGQDGPVAATFSGGRDLAKNPLTGNFANLFIVDTVAPRVVSVNPSADTTVAKSPTPIRIVLEDPADSNGQFSGVDTSRTQVTVQGPINAAGTGVGRTGTVVPFDPSTVDFILAAPLTEDGKYRITINAFDKVGNPAAPFTSDFILDTTPIALAPGVIECTPADKANVSPTTIPGTSSRPFVLVRVNATDFSAAKSLLEVNDFCRVPPKVPGSKAVVSPNTMRFDFAGALATDGSQDGTYATAITLADSVGNLSPQTFCTFIYDSLVPLVDRTFPENGKCTNGPLRIVDATLTDPTPDACRAKSGISRANSTMKLFLKTPNSFVNTQAPKEIKGVLRFQSVGNIDKIALEVVDRFNFPSGLKADGTDDGLYRMEIQAVDNAGNRSVVTSSEFTYDTLPPELAVDKIKDNDAVSGTKIQLTGTVRDNPGGGDIDRVIATLISVGSNNVPTTSVPIFQSVTAVLNTLPEPNSGTPPQRKWVLDANLVNVSAATRARLTVQAFDKCGNFRDIGFTVNVVPGLLPAPTLSAPASGICTPINVVDFAWQPVAGAADYQFRLRTPKGNEIVRNTGNKTTLKLNLAQQGDGDGQYIWTVAAVDGGMQLGGFARNFVFNIDVTPPKVIAIDAQDPSPDSRGVLTAGESRFTVTFDEKMRLTSGLKVELVPIDNRSLPALPVTTISFAENIWVGKATIPVNNGRDPDYNGIAELAISGGRDCAGNPMAAPNHGLQVFEVNAGPLLKIAFFQNPIDRKDLVVLLKGFTREGGPAVRLVDLPVITMVRPGEREQAPRLQRINDSTFQGLFRFSPSSTVPITLIATARDEGGNTATRTITLNVNTISPGEALVVAPSTGVRLMVPAGAVESQATLISMPRKYSLAVDGKIEVPSDGSLVPVAPIDQLAPLGFAFSKPAQVQVDVASLVGVQRPELMEKAALFQRVSTGWEYLPQTRAGKTVVAQVNALYPLAMLADVVAPVVNIESPQEGAKLDPNDPAVVANVTDRGAGFELSGLKALMDGQTVPVTLDEKTGQVRADLSSARAGEHEIVLAAADRTGNVTRVTRRMVAVPALGISEFVPFPNPARLSSRLRYRLAGPVDSVEIRIYDVASRLVRKLSGDTNAGRQTVEWQLDNDAGRGVANGVYLVKMTASGGGREVSARTRIAVMR